MTRAVNAMVSGVAVLAWLAASNHCAMASLRPAPSAAAPGHEHCPGHQAPAKKDKSGGCDGQNCCKSLFAPVTALAKNPVAYDATLFVARDYFEGDRTLLREQHDAPISELDTGPPYCRTFAQLVLQHSVRAHAPPLFL
jgi:hypothetical protein